ncbi:hypothetical protein F5887DRAFT_1086716 [Amanita rubescens]|nr:hypothetical protein F5887DRAFT_1086716 [Amanita rubescens]
MSPAKRKRAPKSAKSSVIVKDSDMLVFNVPITYTVFFLLKFIYINSDNEMLQTDGQRQPEQNVSDNSDDEKRPLKIMSHSKKQKTSITSEDGTVVERSSAENVRSDPIVPNDNDDPVLKVKKPTRFKLRNDSALAVVSQTASSSHGRLGLKSVTPIHTMDSDAVQNDSAPSSQTFSTEIDPAMVPGKQTLFLDSDIDNSNDSGNDSDGLHSAHSLEMRSPTNAVKKIGPKDSGTLYLDSFPDITDSGIKRNKQIQNDPLTLKDEEIDPLLRDDHKSLPALRQVSIHITNVTVIPFVRYGQPQPEPDSNVALGYEKVVQNMASGPAGKRQLEAAVKFTYTLPFVNPSQASHGLVVYDGGKICFNKGENSKQGRNTVFLTTGLIIESQLKIPADSTINPGHKVRQVVLLPFVGEVQRLLAYIGTVFETDEYVCLLESGSLIFTTRREGAGADYNNQGNYASTSASTSPVRSRVPAGLLTSSPVKLGTTVNPNKGKTSHFSPSLGFKDPIVAADFYDKSVAKCAADRNGLPLAHEKAIS